ncbi:MAG: hypothetical protein KDC10_15640 [Calditrichaeota bacterium]|nr:hypothetical protein [Candidatus Cloacimonadota bacterium]MCA9785131.1 hypothetical protein [Candidatus Cloacimonadota bacterium]MCB1048627.1 hypothetical protein [Calditrichota bacterium]
MMSNVFRLSIVLAFCCLWVGPLRAEQALYWLESVITDTGARITGTFSWSWQTGDFENGSGQFLQLDIPHSTHDQSDLICSFDPGSSIEITLAGSSHDDGVDIMLVLQDPLQPGASSLLDIAESRYEIGGNGFHTGVFLFGRIAPVEIELSIETLSPDSARLSWTPAIPGFVLQQTSEIQQPDWTPTSNGASSPVSVSLDGSQRFYRVGLAQPF